MRTAIRMTGGLVAAGLAVSTVSLAAPASASASEQAGDGGDAVSTQAVKTYTGKYALYDMCIEALGKHWYLIDDPRYKVGGNGGLYGPKGFIAYKGWTIKIKGTAHRYRHSSTCTTYYPNYYFKKATIWHP
jgi:hypothetical protein